MHSALLNLVNLHNPNPPSWEACLKPAQKRAVITAFNATKSRLKVALMVVLVAALMAELMAALMAAMLAALIAALMLYAPTQALI